MPIYSTFESTLLQTINYIRNGIYELYFINKNIKKYQIVISKWIFNTVITFISVLISYVIYLLISHLFKVRCFWILNGYDIIAICVVSLMAVSIGLIASTLIKDEKNIYLCIALDVAVFLIIFKTFELLNFYSDSILLLVISIVSLIAVWIASHMFKRNRFINRDS